MEQPTMFGAIEKPTVINVAQVRQLSPFRYPGGKTWLVPIFREWLHSLPYRPRLLIEPFAGGGIISLTAAYLNLVEKAIIIEKDEEVAAVWNTIIYGNWKWLVNRIITFELNQDSAKKVIETNCITTEEIAFRTILKNRIYHGGILAEGSGLLKNGENGKGIHSRWYPETLARRIETIVNIKEKLEFYEGDAFEFIKNYNAEDAAFFVDPPYTASKKKAGKRLYRYFDIDHIGLFKLLHNIISDFMLTYDYDDTVINLAETYGFRYQKIPMTGTHTSLRYELIITNN